MWPGSHLMQQKLHACRRSRTKTRSASHELEADEVTELRLDSSQTDGPV